MRALANTLIGLIAAAAVGAGLSCTGVRVLDAQRPHDALSTEPATVLDLLAHNARVALWPLLLVALAWSRMRITRLVGDALVAGHVLGHGALLGSALAQRPELWRYLPHLPFEWLAIALPVAAWSTARRGPGRPGSWGLVALATLVLVLLALAAIVETYAVPL